MGFLSKTEVETIELALSHNSEPFEDAKDFRARIEENTGKKRSYRMYLSCLNQLGEMRTDISKKLMVSLEAGDKEEQLARHRKHNADWARRKAKKTTKRVEPASAPDPIINVDRSVWMKTEELAKIFNIGSDTIRKAMLQTGAERIQDPKNHLAYLYRVNDVRAVYGGPGLKLRRDFGTRRVPGGTPISHPIAKARLKNDIANAQSTGRVSVSSDGLKGDVARAIETLAQPATSQPAVQVAQPASPPAVTSSNPVGELTDVQALYDLFKRGFLTGEQLGDALNRLRASHAR